MRPSDNPWQGRQSAAALLAALVRACLGSQCGVSGGTDGFGPLWCQVSLSSPFPTPLAQCSALA